MNTGDIYSYFIQLLYTVTLYAINRLNILLSTYYTLLTNSACLEFFFSFSVSSFHSMSVQWLKNRPCYPAMRVALTIALSLL